MSADTFAVNAVSTHTMAIGSLRDIDRIAITCLRAAARKSRDTVERVVVSRILKAATA